ncbi:hypothetical protein G7Y89_g10409 [Cudoniella acicularis]|uniref:Amidase domain-containing protein n=1 Tax=Cudoniella acicularis TaxID=354080 RepID=A0A8H4RGI1_9HELO|nr:hypothetical protein G7Y89_g10409 [Cudoniella acicularis]
MAANACSSEPAPPVSATPNIDASEPTQLQLPTTTTATVTKKKDISPSTPTSTLSPQLLYLHLEPNNSKNSTILSPRKGLEDNEGNMWAWKARTEGAPEGPLRGMRMALKDNIVVKDVPMLFGTDIFTNYVPNVDATMVTRLLEAGAIIEGKAVCENLSLCASFISAATRLIENPYADGYSCGGSSSGCGHPVGAGKVDGQLEATREDPSDF